jgi:hypothetical protein
MVITKRLACLLSVVLLSQVVFHTRSIGAASDWRYDAAVAWAKQQLPPSASSTQWGVGRSTLCGQFVAYSLFVALGTASSSLPVPDVPGTLVFFSPNTGNGGAGHVGLYVGKRSDAGGNDWMISVTSAGVRWDRVSAWDSTVAKFIGVADPPADWPGRTDSSPGPLCQATGIPPHEIVLGGLAQDSPQSLPNPTPVPPPTPAPSLLTVTGRLTSPESPSGAKGVWIFAFASGASARGSESMTDAGGNFTLKLAPGSYLIDVGVPLGGGKPGYCDNWYWGQPQLPSGVKGRTTPPANFAVSADVSGFNLVLPAGVSRVDGGQTVCVT